MTVSVLVPWRSNDQHRDRSLHYIIERFKEAWPCWQVVTGEHNEGPWCKASAVADGLTRADGDLLVIHDADVWCDRLADAVEAVELGAPWAVPHRQVRRLTREATAEVLAGGELHDGLPLAQRPYTGYSGGGIVVLPHASYEQVPFDQRFTGWGQEDSSAAIAWTCLLGDPVRLDGVLWHLWHPPQQRMTRVKGTDAGWRLFKRFQAARRDPSAMRALVAEGQPQPDGTLSSFGSPGAAGGSEASSTTPASNASAPTPNAT